MKKKAIPLAVLMLIAGGMVHAQDAATPAPAAPAAADDIQKVIVTSTGSRGSQRTMVDTPVPVDVLSTKELTKTGQVSLDKALQYRVPSFNTVQTPVNDATSLLDPYEIRNMGPSRALILINGKRKNSSALIYTQTSPGRGESGSDISAIPADAIKRIEVLRDGASAQYGSDAIAGVVNIILKDNAEGGALNVRAGQTHKNDGKNGAVSINNGMSLDGKGFINYTLDLSKVDLAQRSGLVNAQGEASDFYDPSTGETRAEFLANKVLPFLAIKPDAGNINGSPATEAAKFLVNSRYDLTDDLSIYGNAAYIKKTVDSFANYRTPYWRPTDFGKLHAAGTPYVGYVPTFVGSLDDYNGTIGAKFTIDGWGTDISLTTGGNEQTYNVENSVNRSLGATSPTRFYAGGTKFTHYVFNADVSKEVAKGVSAYFGTEARHEKYEILAGEEASYIGGGADSYAGNDPANSYAKTRSNFGIYGGAMFDVTDKFLVDATGRYERYSDFGSAFVWKLSQRYKVSDALTLRASLSTGFRAPSLHQIYTQKAQYSFVPGQGIQVSGLASNISTQVRSLGVPLLDAEKSNNLTLGMGWKPDNNTSVTFDYYNIALKDRIVLGKEIAPVCGDPAAPGYAACLATSQLDQILKAGGIVSLSFFVNALDSRTSGIDYVLNRKNINLLDGKFAVNLSGNYTLKNERDGAVHNPASVAGAGQSVLDITQEALMFTSRPKFKTILGLDLDYSKVNFSLNNTVFGPTKFRNAGMNQNLEVAFKTKTVTDFSVNFQVAKNMTLAVNVNNMFNVTPKWDFKALNSTGQALLDDKSADPVTGLTQAEVQRNLISFNRRYDMVTYDGSHFSQLGRMYNVSLNYRF